MICKVGSIQVGCVSVSTDIGSVSLTVNPDTDSALLATVVFPVTSVKGPKRKITLVYIEHGRSTTKTFTRIYRLYSSCALHSAVVYCVLKKKKSLVLYLPYCTALPKGRPKEFGHLERYWPHETLFPVMFWPCPVTVQRAGTFALETEPLHRRSHYSPFPESKTLYPGIINFP
jgi:hypothetical protein